MPSTRRLRVYGIVAFVVVMVLYYMSSSDSMTRDSPFYRRTRAALDAQVEAARVAAEEKARADALRDERAAHDNPGVGSRLSAAEVAAKKAANDKSQRFLDSVGGGNVGERGVAGRVRIAPTEVDKLQGVATIGGKARDTGVKHEDETVEEHEVEVELDAILKKSPIIIFSKSYCPHSADAKHILLDTYAITPKPYVVELDKHPLGFELQSHLAKWTGRRTVPNVIVQGKSLGGGDDMIELHENGKLIETIKTTAGSRVEAKLRRTAEAGEADEP